MFGVVVFVHRSISAIIMKQVLKVYRLFPMSQLQLCWWRVEPCARPSLDMALSQHVCYTILYCCRNLMSAHGSAAPPACTRAWVLVEPLDPARLGHVLGPPNCTLQALCSHVELESQQPTARCYLRRILSPHPPTLSPATYTPNV